MLNVSVTTTFTQENTKLSLQLSTVCEVEHGRQIRVALVSALKVLVVYCEEKLALGIIVDPWQACRVAQEAMPGDIVLDHLDLAVQDVTEHTKGGMTIESAARRVVRLKL